MKELETTKRDTKAMGENTSNKAKTMRRSSFKITSIIDTARSEEEEEKGDLEEITETTDIPVVSPEHMTTDNPSEKSLATYIVSKEGSNNGSNPRVEYHHAYSERAEHVVKKDVTETNASTYAPAHPIYHSDDESKVSEPGEDNTVSNRVNDGDTLNDLSDHAKPMNTMSVCDKGTTDGSVTEIIMRTDDDKKESEASNGGSQGKSTRLSILLEKMNNTNTTPELKNGKDITYIETNEQAWFNNHPDGRESAETNDPKEVTDHTHGHVRGEDELGKFKAPELEI